MRTRTAIGATAATMLLGAVMVRSALQTPTVRSVTEDEKVLRQYAGVYQWEPNGFVYLQLWSEFTGKNQLCAFDESGEVRALYPTESDRFFAGPGAAVATAIESRIEFQRDAAGTISSLVWQREGAPPRRARRVEIERHEEVRFSSGDVQLAGTLISPSTGGKHPAVILVHASGPQNRDGILPFARFLIRHGMAVLGYDKRGVGGSTGDWNTASFADLADDTVAAFEYLKTRRDIDSTQIGLLGWSQAGWIMPLAAVRAKDIAFLISVSGAGIPSAETTLDQTQNEMTARGMKPQTVADIVAIMKLQYQFARTGQGWDEYAAARGQLAVRIGPPPDTFPATPDHPQWQTIRRLYFYDPAPTLRQLQVPTLALFGELDNNILGKEQGCLGGGAQSRWQSGLHAANSAGGESRPARSEDWKQRGNGVIAAVRPALPHDHPGLARETDPGLRSASACGSMNNLLRVLIVDDEKPGRERLRHLANRDARVELAGCCAGGAEALQALRDASNAGQAVDVLLLDVQMPEVDGFAVVAALVEQAPSENLPAVVFVTAHDEYALRAFDAHAVDYLLKPFSDERFQAALDRAIRHVRAGHAHAIMSRMQALLGSVASRDPLDDPDSAATRPRSTLDRIVLKGPNRIRLLPVEQISWIEADGMYVKLHTRDGGVHLHRALLGALASALDERRFVRIHRSAIVNIDLVDELRQDAHGDYVALLRDRTEVRVGRRFRARLQDRLGQAL